MKTYLFDTFNRYKRFSESLDVMTILCNKSWRVFNDSGEKEVYIFQTDGSLVISYGGKVTHATWHYISVNKSLLISSKEQSYMLHPTFKDNLIFALQLDGTEQYSFMIDENQSTPFQLTSFSELQLYFQRKEEEGQRLLIYRQEEKIRRQQIEEHNLKRERLYSQAANEWERCKNRELSALRVEEKNLDKRNKKNIIIICGIVTLIYWIMATISTVSDCDANDIGKTLAMCLTIYPVIALAGIGPLAYFIIGILYGLFTNGEYKALSRQMDQRREKFIQDYIDKNM